MPRSMSSNPANYFVSGYICKNCQQTRPTQVQIFAGDKALQSAFGHIGGSRLCRLAKLGLEVIRIPFGARDPAVGGSGAAGPARAQAERPSSGFVRLASIFEGTFERFLLTEYLSCLDRYK